jgi:hypothetical protein
MKKLFLLFLSICAFSIVLMAQDDNDWDTKAFDIGFFDEIYLQGGYKVFLSQDDACGLEIKARDNEVFDYLKIKNEQGRLVVDVERRYFNYDRISLYISFVELQKMKVEGGLNLKTKGYLDLDDFSLKVEGGAKIEMDLKADDVQISSEGGVLVELNGVAESLNVKISGAGHIDAEEFKSKDVTIGIEGVGTSSVYATEALYAKIEGVGKVKYRGNPRVTKDIDGLGTVKKD